MNEKEISSDRELLNQKNEAVKLRELFTDKEASAYLRVSQVTLWRLRKDRKINFRRVASKIVYLREDIDAYLDKNKRSAFAVEGGGR